MMTSYNLVMYLWFIFFKMATSFLTNRSAKVGFDVPFLFFDLVSLIREGYKWVSYKRSGGGLGGP